MGFNWQDYQFNNITLKSGPLVKGFLLFISLSFFLNIQAQERKFRRFKVEGGLLLSVQQVGESYFTCGGYFEPKFNLNDQLTMGFRFEGAQLFDYDYINSTIVTCDHYFSTNRFRTFAGGGIGLYDFGVYQKSPSRIEEFRDDIGVAPRVGFLLGHFRTCLTYNLIFGDAWKYSVRYLSFTADWEIGGGLKRKKSKE